MVTITSFNVQGLNNKSKQKRLTANFAKNNLICLILCQKTRHEIESNTIMLSQNKKCVP